jgi:hypothetical protein
MMGWKGGRKYEKRHEKSRIIQEGIFAAFVSGTSSVAVAFP